ncbi:hypothetical protein Xmau_02735 [Xenorhabdus mauleonii]|uniref:Uncharacterized protein n=1 Tax=Xenorhabdus mauleonii TaxID=351675 RepID=A0A1I3I852_9GAMM|nr:hypothetical protein Xmau_02735 [Xenorhabdus mauleonii]SFI44195.1 hypothetical protein SAMN05421680_101233 [Xenorhabdus mauleonii]
MLGYIVFLRYIVVRGYMAVYRYNMEVLYICVNEISIPRRVTESITLGETNVIPKY